jgi:hypothetical protein
MGDVRLWENEAGGAYGMVIGGMFGGGACAMLLRSGGVLRAILFLRLLRLCVGVGVGGAVCALVRDGVCGACRGFVSGAVRGRRSAGCPVYLRQKGFFSARTPWVCFFAGLVAVVPLLRTRCAG